VDCQAQLLERNDNSGPRSPFRGPTVGNTKPSRRPYAAKWIASTAQTIHNSTMTLKNAATLALIGMLLLTVLLALDFFNSVMGVTRGLIPTMAILRSLIYLFASLTVTMFFYVFNRAQSR
jgi:hypothetical protein